MNTHDKIVKCRSCGYVGPCDPTCCEHPDYDGATAEEAWQAAIEAYRQRRGEPVNEEELLAAREALIDMGYLWDGDQWVDVDPPSKTAEQAPEWPDFARMEASLQRLKERLVFENGRRKDLEQRLREKRNG